MFKLSRLLVSLTTTRYRLMATQVSSNSKTHRHLQGLVVAPFTSFDSKGELDCSSFEECFQYFQRSHFNGLFVNGTLGEGMSQSVSERKHVAEKWKHIAADKMFTIVHIGTGNIKESQELAQHAESIGVDAISALPPTYHKPTTEEQLVDYLEQVASAAPSTPFLYYEYNVTTGVYLNIPRALELAEKRIPTLYGLKHTSPELNAALNCSTAFQGKFKVFFGTETQYLPTLSLGIPDVITSPYLGKLFNNIKTAFDAGDMKTAQETQRKAQQLINIQTKYGGGIRCAKAMFELMSGITVGPPRLPLHGMAQTDKDNMRRDLAQAGFITKESQVLIATFRAERADDAMFDELYGKAVAMAEVQEVELYYPFVDHLVVELED